MLRTEDQQGINRVKHVFQEENSDRNAVGGLMGRGAVEREKDILSP